MHSQTVKGTITADSLSDIVIRRMHSPGCLASAVKSAMIAEVKKSLQDEDLILLLFTWLIRKCQSKWKTEQSLSIYRGERKETCDFRGLAHVTLTPEMLMGGMIRHCHWKLMLNAFLNGSYTTHQNSSCLFDAEGSIECGGKGEIIGYAFAFSEDISSGRMRWPYSTCCKEGGSCSL